MQNKAALDSVPDKGREDAEENLKILKRHFLLRRGSQTWPCFCNGHFFYPLQYCVEEFEIENWIDTTSLKSINLSRVLCRQHLILKVMPGIREEWPEGNPNGKRRNVLATRQRQTAYWHRWMTLQIWKCLRKVIEF